MSPRISVLILTWNRRAELALALRSVVQQDMADVEIVVVDSASSDGTQAMLREQFPQVKVVRLPYNLGVIGGRNVGIANCRGELIFFLDDDAMLLRPDALQRVYTAFQQDARLGVLYGKIVDAAGQIRPWLFRGPVAQFGDENLLAYAFVGAAHCIRRALFDELGYMDAGYFRQGEETEFSLRVYGAGYHVLYFPAVTVLHRESQITRNPGGQTEFYKFRNDILTYWKHLPLPDALLFTVWNGLIDLVRAVRHGHLLWYLLALLQLSWLLPATVWRQRRPLPRAGLRLWYATASRVVTWHEVRCDAETAPQANIAHFAGAYLRRYLPAV